MTEQQQQQQDDDDSHHSSTREKTWRPWWRVWWTERPLVPSPPSCCLLAGRKTTRRRVQCACNAHVQSAWLFESLSFHIEGRDGSASPFLYSFMSPFPFSSFLILISYLYVLYMIGIVHLYIYKYMTCKTNAIAQ